MVICDTYVQGYNIQFVCTKKDNTVLNLHMLQLSEKSS